MVCYAEKQVKPFWFSSLDQIVHFGAIIFCRTFVELFWSVRVDRKKKSHYNSRVSLHEAPTKKDNNMGDCSVCGKKVVWNCQKLGNHKRPGNCIGQSDDERLLCKGCQVVKTSFHAEQMTKLPENDHQTTNIVKWVDSLSLYSTGIRVGTGS